MTLRFIGILTDRKEKRGNHAVHFSIVGNFGGFFFGGDLQPTVAAADSGQRLWPGLVVCGLDDGDHQAGKCRKNTKEIHGKS